MMSEYLYCASLPGAIYIAFCIYQSTMAFKKARAHINLTDTSIQIPGFLYHSTRVLLVNFTIFLRLQKIEIC